MKIHTTLTVMLLAVLTSKLIAQSAENFQTPGSDSEAAEVQTKVIDQEATQNLLTAPSRYAGLDQDAYIRVIASSFSMRARDTDPFARHQDPNFKPIQPVIAKSRVAQYKKDPITPFSDIVERINITAVLPAQQIFLVDERSFTIGDRIKLDIGKDQPIAIHVTEIRADGVTFRHGTTGETADRSLKLMPDGMSRGKTIHPPGMVPKNSNAPLDARPRNSISSRR